MKYIDAEKLLAEIERRMKCYNINGCEPNDEKWVELITMKHFIESNQQEQLSGKQVIIITETDGDANIHWDCRSLEDVRALLASAESYISDKQNEESRGCGSGPDYNTEEGRYSNLFKHRQEQPEVDLEKEIDAYLQDWEDDEEIGIHLSTDFGDMPIEVDDIRDLARHFHALGKNSK